MAGRTWRGKGCSAPSRSEWREVGEKTRPRRASPAPCCCRLRSGRLAKTRRRRRTSHCCCCIEERISESLSAASGGMSQGTGGLQVYVVPHHCCEVQPPRRPLGQHSTSPVPHNVGVAHAPRQLSPDSLSRAVTFFQLRGKTELTPTSSEISFVHPSPPAGALVMLTPVDALLTEPSDAMS